MKKILGIELGSTRIKSVLMDENAAVIAQGSFEWENELVDGLWSYSLENVEKGLQKSFAALAEDYKAKSGEDLCEISAIGISAMMHGYLAFGKDLLAENNGNWAINYNNGFYQLFEGDYMIQFDGKIPLALYNYKTDPLLKDNLLNKISIQEEMLKKCKAIIQEYIMRMTTDNLVLK